MKDPAFLFYSSDFLNGVADLTMEERGQFITLLCLQHQKGSVSEKTIRLSLGSVSVDVLSKFERDENGNLFNERLKIEIEKRQLFTESRRNNGLKGGRPKKEEKPSAKPNGKPTQNLMGNVIENENDKENKGSGIDFSIYPEPYRQGLKDWYEYKRENKKTYKPKGWEAFIKIVFNRFPNVEDFNAAVLHSMSCNYDGLFPAKQSRTEDRTPPNMTDDDGDF